MKLFRRRKPEPVAQAAEPEPSPLDPSHFARVFEPPLWLRDLGFMSWFLVGLLALLVGVIWILGLTSTIVEPVTLGAVVAIVAAPLVSSLERHRVPRAAGAAAVLLGFIGIVVVVVALVIGGIADEATQIKNTLAQSADTIEQWFNDTGANNTDSTKSDVTNAVATSGTTLLNGLASGIRNLTSLVFFLTFTCFSVFFLLKDGHSVKRWVDRHLGLPVELATLVTDNVKHAMRRYFLGVTLVAAFNAMVVGVGALILGVPLVGTIALVTFVTAYVPYVGAIVAGTFAVLLTLGSQGTETALVMIVIVILANGLLQNLFQPLAFGAALDLNPLAVLIVTIASGALFGMIGMVLAAPLLSAAVHTARRIGEAKARDQVAAEATPGPAHGVI